MTKNIPSGALHISGTIYHMIVIYGTLMISSDIFFTFSKFWFSGLLGGGGDLKGQKMVQNEKKFCLSISQESYII